MNDEDNIPHREGYMLVVEPIIGLTRLFMTSVTAWMMVELLKTDHGRTFVRHLPALIKATLNTYL